MIQNLVLLLSLVSLNLHRIEVIDKTTIVLQARIERFERLFEDLNAKLADKQTCESAAKQRTTTVKTTEITADEKDGMASDGFVIERSTQPMKTQTKANETQAKTREDNVTSAISTTNMPGEVSTPTPGVMTPTPATKLEGSCDIAFNGTCYWTHVQYDVYVNFAGAEEICSNNASIPAYFPNEKVYNSVVEDVCSKIPTGRSWIDVWTGVTIDTNTGDVTHPSEDTYVKWYPNNPLTGSSYETFPHVLLRVATDPDTIYQGMLNNDPQRDYPGVVCQKTIE